MSVTVYPQRICALYRLGGLHTAKQVSMLCHCTYRHAQYVIKKMHQCGLLHIAAWLKPEPGEGPRNRQPIAMYATGHKKDVAKPGKDNASVVRVRRLKRLKAQFGTDGANRILRSRREGGAHLLAIDGQIAFKRGKPRGKYLRNTQTHTQTHTQEQA